MRLAFKNVLHKHKHRYKYNSINKRINDDDGDDDGNRQCKNRRKNTLDEHLLNEENHCHFSTEENYLYLFKLKVKCNPRSLYFSSYSSSFSYFSFDGIWKLCSFSIAKRLITVHFWARRTWKCSNNLKK